MASSLIALYTLTQRESVIFKKKSKFRKFIFFFKKCRKVLFRAGNLRNAYPASAHKNSPQVFASQKFTAPIRKATPLPVNRTHSPCSYMTLFVLLTQFLFIELQYIFLIITLTAVFVNNVLTVEQITRRATKTICHIC